jgi:hypothetical protein
MPSPLRFRNCWLSRSRVLTFRVRRFFQPNIDSRGRLVRGGIAALLLIAGGVTFFYIWWQGLVFIGIGIFVLFEAVRGWCLMRACGVKTKF